MKYKSLFLPLTLIILISGCTVSSYQGDYYFPENTVFDEANFKYVTTISGTSSAEWNMFGLDKKKLPEGMAATAKNNMYSTYTFKPNQIITNISTEMVFSYMTFFNIFPLGGYTYTAIVSADVYEFADNGKYNNDPIKEHNEKENTENSESQSQQIKSKEKTSGTYYNGQKCNIIETISDTEVRIKYPIVTRTGFNKMVKKIVNRNEIEHITIQ